MKVSFLVPVFSEVDSVRRTVEIIDETCARHDREIFLLVHEGSIPQCRRTCDDLAQRKPHVRVHVQRRYPGQGYAFREGFELATGTHILMMNADLETEPRDAVRLIEAIERSGADLVIASRWMVGGAVDTRGYGALHTGVTMAFQELIGRLFQTPVRDLTFSYKIGKRELFSAFEWVGTGHELSMETTLRPIAAGRRVLEIPTTWVARREGSSNHAYSRNLRHLRLALAIFLTKATGTPT